VTELAANIIRCEAL